jgi:CMP-N-acetylneuraminic acid synthetase
MRLIPARGGNRGLPGKNIRPLLGKALIHPVVSTDREEIAEVARHFGAEEHWPHGNQPSAEL